MCDSMRSTLKILLGAAMIVAGIYWYSLDALMGTGTSNLDALLVLLKGSAGLIVFLLGVFIVWIESDEMRIQRELEQQDFQPEPYSASGGEPADTSTSQEEVELEAPDYEDIVSGTIDEVKEAVDGRELALDELLEAEKANKDRKTMKAWIEDRMD